MHICWFITFWYDICKEAKKWCKVLFQIGKNSHRNKRMLFQACSNNILNKTTTCERYMEEQWVTMRGLADLQLWEMKLPLPMWKKFSEEIMEVQGHVRGAVQRKRLEMWTTEHGNSITVTYQLTQLCKFNSSWQNNSFPSTTPLYAWYPDLFCSPD